MPRGTGCPGLWSLLDALPRTHWPAFVRGDCAYGNEVLLDECEARGLPRFFKLRHTAKVKTLLAQMQRWTLLLSYIFRRWLGGKWLGQLPPGAEALLSG